MTRTTTRRLASLAACLSLVGLVPGTSSSALGAPRTDRVLTLQFDEEFPSTHFSEACGFDTWYTLRATVFVTFNTDQLIVVRYPQWERILNGPGGSLRLREAGVEQIWTEPSADGYTQTIVDAGHFNHSWVVPGYGPVELRSGRTEYRVTFAWDETAQDFVVVDEQVVDVGGPRDFDLTDDDIAALCGYLG